MYGMPQAGIIAQQLLEERLGKHGYPKQPLVSGNMAPAPSTSPLLSTILG
jgi:hypothetical protein